MQSSEQDISAIRPNSAKAKNRARIVEKLVSDSITTRSERLTRIFQIGFNECGTRSMHMFFEANGIRSVHYHQGRLAPQVKANIEKGYAPLYEFTRWTAYSDMHHVSDAQGVIDASCYFRAFAQYYPRSYFIFNIRDKQDWLESRFRHDEYGDCAERYRRALGLNDFDALRAHWSEQWDRHIANVTGFFAKNPYRFVIFDIDRDPAEKLSDFLRPDFNTNPDLYGHVGKSEPIKEIPAP